MAQRTNNMACMMHSIEEFLLGHEERHHGHVCLAPLISRLDLWMSAWGVGGELTGSLQHLGTALASYRHIRDRTCQSGGHLPSDIMPSINSQLF
jgi:hypothetical protein